MDPVWVAGISAVGGAAAGGAIGFWGNHFLANKNLRKEISLKVAEYRLAWINNLGDELSILLATAVRLGFSDQGKEAQDKAFFETRQEMFRSATRVRLLMNHDDEDYPALDDLIKRIFDLTTKALAGEDDGDALSEDMRLARDKFTTVANAILKREWRRTKDHLRADTIEVSALKSSRRVRRF